jgi:dipeptidyl aminopeptidase/acylaminoacyl peptidase
MAHAHGLPEPRLSPGGGTVTFSWTSPRGPAEIWRFAREAGSLERVTHSPGWPSGLEGVIPERHRVRSFDGEEISVYLYRPATPWGAPGSPGTRSTDSPGRTPVVVVVHGGPESQAVRGFDPVVQALAQAGFAVAVPNVRGSTGYGKRFAALDDVERRLDSVADLGAIHDWLASVGLDRDRAALWGGSYGGYMVLAGLAFQPERWAAGVDIVGISDLVTFLEHTSPYRRAAREREYGSLVSHRKVLEEASPLRRVDAIRAPLFVIHGANDPRVPLSEAEQLVASLGARGVPCELLGYADEGHGLAKLANRMDAYPRAVEFLAERLMMDA